MAKPARKQSKAGPAPEPTEEQIDAAVPSGQKNDRYVPEGFHRFSNLRHKKHTYQLKCLAYWEHIPIYQAEYLVLEEFFKNHKVKDMPPPAPKGGKMPKGFRNLE